MSDRKNDAKDIRSENWQRKMRDFHDQTGLYRAEDIRRVLGDPREGIVSDNKPEDALNTHDWKARKQAAQSG